MTFGLWKAYVCERTVINSWMSEAIKWSMFGMKHRISAINISLNMQLSTIRSNVQCCKYFMIILHFQIWKCTGLGSVGSCLRYQQRFSSGIRSTTYTTCTSPWSEYSLNKGILESSGKQNYNFFAYTSHLASKYNLRILNWHKFQNVY